MFPLTYLDVDEEEKDTISNIYSKFSHAFEQKLLSALFKGEVNSKIETNYNRVSSYIGKNTSSEDKITIIFKYKNSQNIQVGEKSTTYNSIIFDE